MINFLCPVCNNTSWVEREEKPKAWRSTQETFTLLQCSSCDYIKTWPEVNIENILKYYNLNYYDSHTISEDSRRIFDFLYNKAKVINSRQKLNLIKRFSIKDDTFKLLDYGCGNGSFIQFLNRKLIEADGVEFDQNLVTFLKRKNLNVYSFKEFPVNNTKYNVITLFHVLEHIKDFNQVVKIFNEKLKENGLIIIALPNPESFDCKYFKSDWAAWDVPIHYHHFKKGVIVKYMQSMGFNLLHIRPLYFDSLYISYLSEKNKSSFIPLIKGFLIGIYSNLLAIYSREYSSLLYVFQKSN